MIKPILIGLSCLSLSACVIHIGDDKDRYAQEDWKARQSKNQKYIAQLETDASKSKVLNDLGNADLSESHTKDGQQVTVLFYRTNHVDSDGITTKDETTPLVFVNGKLKGWGASAYRQYSK